jgi:hypothetical protein
MGLCKEKDQLTEKCHKTVRAYSETVKRMADLAGTIPAAEFAYLRLLAENARRLSAAARNQLHTHLTEHGC